MRLSVVRRAAVVVALRAVPADALRAAVPAASAQLQVAVASPSVAVWAKAEESATEPLRGKLTTPPRWQPLSHQATAADFVFRAQLDVNQPPAWGSSILVLPRVSMTATIPRGFVG